MSGRCNCGRAFKYNHPNGLESCNKHNVCPTYEDQVNTIDVLRSSIRQYKNGGPNYQRKLLHDFAGRAMQGMLSRGPERMGDDYIKETIIYAKKLMAGLGMETE